MIESNDPIVAERLLYSRLSDEIMFFGNNAVIRINTLLYRSDNRPKGIVSSGYYYYQENQYMNKNAMQARAIIRNIDVYLSIENLKKFAKDGRPREYMVLRGRDIEMMRILLLPKLEHMLTNLDKIFQYRDGKLYVDENIKVIEVEIGSREKALYFRPGAHKLYNDEVVPCLEAYLNSPNNITIMSIGNVYEFIYFIRNINLYQYAAIQLAAFGNPPMGLNMYDVGMKQTMNMITDFQYEDPKRMKGKGFFTQEIKKRQEENKE